MDIEGIKRKMLVKYPAFGSVVANLKYVGTKDCSTAATDGNSIYYNPDFLDTLVEDEQVFVFAHEVCHVAFNHIFRSEGKDKRLWNVATDAVINALLKQDGLKMIEGGVDIPEAVQYDAEQMYEKLLKQQEEQQKEQQNSNGSSNQKSGEGNGNSNSNSQSNGDSKDDNDENESQENNQENANGTNGQSSEQNQSNDDGQNVGHDSHTLWDEAIKKAKEKSSNSEKKEDGEEKTTEAQKEEDSKEDSDKSDTEKKEDSKGSSDKSDTEKKEDNKGSSDKSDAEKNEQIEKLTQAGERKTFQQNQLDRKKQLDKLREILAKESVGFGNEASPIKRDVGEIGKASSLVDWRKLLKEAVNSNVDWSYKNADIEDGVITPHIEEFPRPETEIVLDTSGSIHETLLRNFLRECKNILAESRVKVGCFDTRFYGFNEIRNEKDIENMRFRGGGGTDFDVAVEAFSRRVENKIIFTDGEADMPAKSMDAIWIVFGEERIKPKGGKVIRITKRQLEKLYRSHNMDISR